MSKENAYNKMKDILGQQRNEKAKEAFEQFLARNTKLTMQAMMSLACLTSSTNMEEWSYEVCSKMPELGGVSILVPLQIPEKIVAALNAADEEVGKFETDYTREQFYAEMGRLIIMHGLKAFTDNETVNEIVSMAFNSTQNDD